MLISDKMAQKNKQEIINQGGNKNDRVATNWGNNTYQYAVPGQTELLNLDSIKIMDKLEKMNWPLPSVVSNATL